MAPETNFMPSALSTNAFSRTGYAFAGWNSAADGSGSAYADGATDAFTANQTLFAQWAVNASLQRHLRRQRLDGRPHGPRDQLTRRAP